MRRQLVAAAGFILMYFALGICSASMASAGEEYAEPPIVLDAKNVLPAKLLQGKNYQIENRVENDGLLNTYQVSTPYGTFALESTALLMGRIAELNAMTVMEEMDKQKVFGDAVLAGVKAPFQGAARLVTEPVETTKGIVKGTGRFISNMGRSIVSDDPHQDNTLKVALGYDTTKRVFAYDLGINPYSGYEPVISMLGSISQASVAGGLAPKAAMSAVGGGVGTAMSLSGTAEGMRKLVRDNPPGELQKINASKLAAMGLSQSLIDALLNNYAFDPQEATMLVGELDSMKKVKGRDEFVAAASLASDHRVAVFYGNMARMMAGYHTNVSPVESIGRLAGTPCARKKDGAVVLLVPVDYVVRTAEVEGKLKRIDDAIGKAGGAKDKELWITGMADESARKMLSDGGWKIVEKADRQLMK